MTDEKTPDAPLCGDVDGPRTCMSRPHHGNHVDGAGHEWPQWYRDGESDLWVSVDETGDRLRLVVVDRQYLGVDGDGDNSRVDVETKYHALTPMPTMHVPAQYRQTAAAPVHRCPELPDVPPSLEWSAALIESDRAELLADVEYAAGRGLPELEAVLRLWWVFAKNHDAPLGLPVVDQATVTAALDEPLPRNLPEDAAPGSFRDALTSFFAYIDDDEDDEPDAFAATTEGGTR